VTAGATVGVIGVIGGLIMVLVSGTPGSVAGWWWDGRIWRHRS